MARKPKPVADTFFPDAIDVHASALIGVYARAAKRLRVMIQGSLLSGKMGQAAYRQERAAEVDGIMDRLQRDSGRNVQPVIERAYSAGVLAANDTTGIRVAFGVVHQDAVRVLTKAMTERLDTAATQTRASAKSLYVQDTITALAETRAGRTPVGRRIDDQARSSALRVLAEREITGDTIHEASKTLRSDLEQHGMTAVRARNGARIPLDVYSRTVARTTTREAVTLGTANRLVEGGQDLVTVSSHRHQDGDPICIPFAGNTYSLTGKTAGYPVLPMLPPFHPNAILGDDQEVTPLGGALAGVRARYNGPAFEFECLSGVRFRVSPNHPVLTRRGWIPARLVRQGDQVLRDRRADRRGAVTPASQHFDDVPSRAADLFQAMRATSPSWRAVAAADDLHGDAAYCDREVDVVRADGQLGVDFNSALAEQSGQQVFGWTESEAARLAREGASFEPRYRIGAPVAGPLPDGYPSRPEPSEQSGLRECSAAHQVLHAHAVQVTGDQVVQIRYDDRWSGHAYDFQTGSELYLLGSIAVHNCRHVITPAAASFEALEAALGLAPT